MRTVFVILLAIAIQAGLFARLAPEGEFCPRSVIEDCSVADGEAPPDGCGGDHTCPDGDKCPAKGHHHHHGSCIHSVPLTIGGEGACELRPPMAVTLACEAQDMRAPDGPVRDLDKPPLI